MHHRARRVIVASAVAVCIGAGAASAVSFMPQELLPAEKIIARYVDSIGGADAVRAHSSTQVQGTMELLGQGIQGEVRMYAAAPNKALMIVSFPDLDIESRQGYNGEVAWAADPMTGERILQGDELQQIVDESDYYSDLHDSSRFQSMETLEVTEYAGRLTYKVKLVYVSGRETFEYFDVDNGRLVGAEGLQYSLMGAVNVRTFISEYRQFGPLMVPTKIIQEIGPGRTVQVTFESIQYDNVESSTFALPASIEALVG